MSATPEKSFNQETRDLITDASRFMGFPDRRMYTHVGKFTDVAQDLRGLANLMYFTHLRRFVLKVTPLITNDGEPCPETLIGLEADPLSGPDQARTQFLRKGYSDADDQDIRGRDALEPIREFVESLKEAKTAGTIVLS